jgi:type I restriction enzyme R subunit
VIELKRGSVQVADGIRQLETNQEEIFNTGFFSTVQLVFAGNESQGLRYGTVTTEAKFFVEWSQTPDFLGSCPSGSLQNRPKNPVVHQNVRQNP